MGGASSCTFRSSSGDRAKSVKVIDNRGRVQEFMYSVRAAEIMAENPGEFVCDSSYLQIGCRIPGLAAGEELRRRRIYFLLPTDLLFSVLTEEEMTWLLGRAAGATPATRRRRRRSSRVSSMKMMEQDSLKKVPAEQSKAEQSKAVEGCRRNYGAPAAAMHRVRSWEPALDPISE